MGVVTMANVNARDGDGNEIFFGAAGVGSTENPHVPHVYDATERANERNSGDAALRYGVAVPECVGTTCGQDSAGVLDINGDETVSADTPALLFGVYVLETFSAHSLNLRDGIDATGTLKITIPASAVAGTKYEFNGIKFNIGIFADWDAAATAGQVVVEWRAQ